MIAFLGTGYLGSNMARALLQCGNALAVWNRTYEKAQALEPYGARAFRDAQSAVIGADRIHIVLKDDASVDELLECIQSALEPGATIIDHTTTSTQGAIDRTGIWKGRGFCYLHAPVFMSPENALACEGSMLLSGDQDVIDKWQPELQKMTGKVVNYGPVTGKAAAVKLVRNHYIIGMNAALFEALNLGTSLGVEPGLISDLFTGGWNPGAVLPSRIGKITAGNFEVVAWELQMARKDVALMLTEAKEKGVTLEHLEIVARVMDQHIADGDSKKDWTIMGRDFAKK